MLLFAFPLYPMGMQSKADVEKTKNQPSCGATSAAQSPQAELYVVRLIPQIPPQQQTVHPHIKRIDEKQGSEQAVAIQPSLLARKGAMSKPTAFSLNPTLKWPLGSGVRITSIVYESPTKCIVGTPLGSCSCDYVQRKMNMLDRKCPAIFSPRFSTPTPKHSLAIEVRAFSPNGSLVAYGSYDKTISIWDARSNEHKFTLEGHDGPVVAVKFIPDSSALVAASSDGTASIWNMASGEKIHVLTGHKANVLDIDISPDGKMVATASVDGSVRIWDVKKGILLCLLVNRPRVATKYEPICPNPKIDGDWIMKVSFSPDSKTLTAGASDGNVLVWDIGFLGIENGIHFVHGPLTLE